jgi:adenylosuccinate synthase
VGRRGIRFSELLDFDEFSQIVNANLEEKNFVLENFFQDKKLDQYEVIKQYSEYAMRLKPYIEDISVFINSEVKSGSRILFEGAQGTHLDVDHGTYPFVTSSTCVASNACSGAGVGPKLITDIFGVVKAYTTRVGAGPFPTELFDEIGDKLQEKGAEFGATTGRKRRCGWLDMVILKNAVRLNSLTGLVITKLDVLCGLESIKICIGYDYKGKLIENFPANLKVLSECKPIYETLPGWNENIEGIRDYNDLPEATKHYLKRIEDLAGVKIQIVSVGPGRDETIILNNPFL